MILDAILPQDTLTLDTVLTYWKGTEYEELHSMVTARDADHETLFCWEVPGDAPWDCLRIWNRKAGSYRGGQWWVTAGVAGRLVGPRWS